MVFDQEFRVQTDEGFSHNAGGDNLKSIRTRVMPVLSLFLETGVDPLHGVRIAFSNDIEKRSFGWLCRNAGSGPRIDRVTIPRIERAELR